MDLMFSNTYHLLLQPGRGVIKKAGGLHSFINRDKPIITDSGGFQVFSLKHNSAISEIKRSAQSSSKNGNSNGGSVLKIDEEGVTFRSYYDGQKILLTPESSVDAQKDFGANIILPLDELPAHDISKDKLMESLLRTHRWEERSLNRHLKNRNQQAMYGIIHGSTSKELREFSTNHLLRLNFDGMCIGGSLGKDSNDLLSILEVCMPILHADTKQRPIHLLGIGDEKSILSGIENGVDSFDSAFPTKVARHGTVFVKSSSNRTEIANRINLRSSKFKNDLRPIDEECTCVTCRNHSRAYLHHLIKAKEPAAHSLLSHHNLRYTLDLVNVQREKILDGEI
jgi:queuine tRNA-ribosyltransferase